MKAQSALSVKEANLKAMTAFIYTQGSATKQMFEHELGLSLPTITQNLRAMEADGLIVKGEMQQSTGGRKAQIYEFAAHSSVAIGVRIQTTRITAIAIDLNGKSVATSQRTLPYRNNDAYYQRMNGIINDFAQELAKQGIQQMIKDSEKRLFDIVLVWKLDRFARNRYDSAHYFTASTFSLPGSFNASVISNVCGS